MKPTHAALIAALLLQGCALPLTQSGSFAEDWRESVRLVRGVIAADDRHVECVFTTTDGHICAQVPSPPY